MPSIEISLILAGPKSSTTGETKEQAVEAFTGNRSVARRLIGSGINVYPQGIDRVKRVIAKTPPIGFLLECQNRPSCLADRLKSIRIIVPLRRANGGQESSCGTGTRPPPGPSEHVREYHPTARGAGVRLLSTLWVTCRERTGSACDLEGPKVGVEGGQSLTSNPGRQCVGGAGVPLADVIGAE